MPENNFQILKIPMTVAATELRLGETHYFSEGELIPAIMASCTIPAVFHPLTLRGGLYVDGGVLDNFPVQPLKTKCDFIVGSQCNHILKEFDPRNMRVVVERTLLMAINMNTQISKSQCDVVIEPPGLGRYSAFEIAKAGEIFDFAYTFTKENFTEQHFVKNPT
jgi:NTE family protein